MLKKTLGAAAVALALAGPAQAYGPTVTPDYILYVGGGSDQNVAFEIFAKSLFLNDANLDVYTDQADGSAGRTFRAVYGTLATTVGVVPAGSKVLINWRTNNGVWPNAVGPVVRATPLAFIQALNNATATGNALPQPTYRITNVATTVNVVPDLGLAAHELTLNTGINVPAGGFELTATDKSNVTSSPSYTLCYGVAVTDNLYAQKPNFTRNEITAILSGLYTDWSQLNDAAGNPLPAGHIVLIDRNAGASTKLSANQYFLNNPGGKAYGGVVQPINASGDVGDPTNYSTYTVKTITTSSAVPLEIEAVYNKGQRGITILGREYINSAANGTHWSFVSIDGISAGTKTWDKTNAVKGTYDWYYTGAVNVRRKSVNGAHFSGDTSAAGRPYSDLIGAFRAAAQNPLLAIQLTGIVLDPNVVTPGAFPAADPFITRGTRFSNSTAPLQLQF